MSNKNHKFILIILLISFTVCQTSCRKEKNRICDLYSGSVDYAVGTVNSSLSTPARINSIYTFIVDGITYEGTEKSYGLGQSGDSMIGKQFVVVYQQGVPSNCDLNTDYWLILDTDFEEFINEHQNKKPQQDFPNKCK